MSVSYTLAGCRYIDSLCYPLNATLREPNGAQYTYKQVGQTEQYLVGNPSSAGTLTYA